MARVDDIELAHFQRKKFLNNKKVLSVDNIEKKLKRNSNEIISKYKEDDSKETNKPVFDLIKNTNFISKDRIFKVTLGEDNKEKFLKKFSGLH